jgi:CheY-like chemotaxis protein
VIEDDRIIRTMLGDLLAACGYQVTLAENGVEGLSRFADGHYAHRPPGAARRRRVSAAMLSNTARAHELGRTRDWVVPYFRTDHRGEGPRTIVTERQGPMAGRRVVRGREADCIEHRERAAEESAAEPERGGAGETEPE